MQKKKPEYHRLTIDLEPDLYKKLKKRADEDERTASKQAKLFIKYALENLET